MWRSLEVRFWERIPGFWRMAGHSYEVPMVCGSTLSVQAALPGSDCGLTRNGSRGEFAIPGVNSVAPQGETRLKLTRLLLAFDTNAGSFAVESRQHGAIVQNRSFGGNARHADPSYAPKPPDARLVDFRTHSADFGRRPASEPGRGLSGAAPAGASRLAHSRKTLEWETETRSRLSEAMGRVLKPA